MSKFKTPKQNRIKKHILKQPFALVFFVLMILYSISMLVPIAWTLLSSLKTRLDFRLNPFGLPKTIALENYMKAFNALYITIPSGEGTRDVFMFEMLANTLFYAIGATVVGALSHILVAYVCAKYRHFKITKVLHTIVVVTMILPIVGSLPSEMQVIKAVGFYNNPVGAWFLKASFLGSSFLIYYATFKGIAWDYAEAAFIDGAGHSRVLFTIMIPLVKNVIVGLMLLAFIGYWNDANMSMIYMPHYPSIAYGLFRFQFLKGQEASSISVQLAGCTVVMIPIFVLFMVFRKQLIGNIAIGGLKG